MQLYIDLDDDGICPCPVLCPVPAELHFTTILPRETAKFSRLGCGSPHTPLSFVPGWKQPLDATGDVAASIDCGDEGALVKIWIRGSLAIGVTNALFLTKEVLEMHETGSNSCDYPFTFNKLRRENVCGLRSLNIALKISEKVELSGNFFKRQSHLIQMLKIIAQLKILSLHKTLLQRNYYNFSGEGCKIILGGLEMAHGHKLEIPNLFSLPQGLEKTMLL